MSERAQRFFRAESLDVDDDVGTVHGRVVPFDTPARVVDTDGDYLEVFTAASFKAMLQGLAARANYSTVLFDLDHRADLDHRIGYGQMLESRDDGLYATFGLYDGHDLPKVRSMLRTSHRGLSIDFHPGRTRTRPDGTRERLGVHLYGVAATPTPIYADAKILAVRADTDMVPVVETPRLDAAMSRWGITAGVPSPQTTS